MARALALLVISLLAYSTLGADYDADSAWRYVQFSGAAYCCGTFASSQSCVDWDCQACKGNLVVTDIKNASTQGRGFAGYDEDTGTIVIGFSGTDPLSIQDWIDDIDTVKVDYPNCDGCQVHKGFYDTYLSVKAQVHSVVETYMSLYRPSAIEVTGHSLGAALAQHCALDLALSGYSVYPVYNFGQPRTGNQQFSDFYSATISQTYRITHWKDPVPHLPWESWGFHHEPLEIFYSRENKEYTVCDGSGEDPDCADQFSAALNVWDHLTYLNFDFTANYLSCEL